MKKIVSIILAALMLCALCAPAFAEDAQKEYVPDGNISLNGPSFTGNYIIKGEYVVSDFLLGTISAKNVTLTIAKGAKVTVTNSFINYGTINVCGTLIFPNTVSMKLNYGTVRVFGCGGGKLEGSFDDKSTVNTYNEHNFSNGKCECGYECEHKWDANTGKCTVCELVCAHGGDKCDICGKELVNLNTGSALSEGNMIIICSVATLVIGLCGGFIIGTKKKKKS